MATTAMPLRGVWALVLLAAVPAVFMPGGLDRFTFAKLTVAAVGIALAFSVRPVARLGRAVSVLVVLGVVVVAIAAVASGSVTVALVGRAPRYGGLPVMIVYLTAFFAGVRLMGGSPSGSGARAETVIRIVVTAMAWCITAIAAVAVAEAFGLRPLSSDLSRPGSLLGNASDQGAVAVLYAGLLIAAALRTPRILYRVGAVAAVITTVLSGSRGALVGLCATLVVIAVVYGRKYWRQMTLATAGVIVLALAVPFTRDRVLGLSPLSAKTITGRGLLWRESLSLIADHPFLGVGPNHFRTALVSYHDLRWQQEIGPENPPAEPHNLLLQAASVGGILLLAVLLALGLLLAVRAITQIRQASDTSSYLGDTHRKKKPPRDPLVGAWPLGAAAGLAGYLVVLQFHVIAPGTTIPASLVAGSLAAVPLRGPASRGSLAARWIEPAIRYVVPIAAAALVIVFAAASIGETYLLRAERAINSHDYAAADRAFARAHHLRPWDIDLPGHAMTAFVKPATSGQSGTSDAIVYAINWSKRLGVLATDEQLAQNQAALLQSRGDLAGAASILDRQLSVDPSNPALLTLRGVVSAKAGDTDQAIDYLQRATVVDPTDPDPWHNLAIVYTQLGDTNNASNAQEQADRLTANH